MKSRSIAVLAIVAAVTLVASSTSLAVAPTAVAQTTETVLAQTFDTSPGESLRVDVPDANVTLRTGSSNRVEITARLTASNMERARERVEEMNLQAQRDGSGVTLTGESRNWNWNWRDSGRFQLDVEITLPERYDVNLHTSDGNIETGALQGAVALRTSDGDVRVASVEGTSVTIRTSDGDIQVGNINATEIVINTSDGDVSSGRLAAGKIEVGSSDGDIDLTVAGPLEARTSDGSLTVALETAASTTLRTGDGDIDLTIPASMGADLDLQGGRIKVATGVTIDGTVSRRKAQGTLNGGGPQVRARTGDGSVTLQLRG